MYLCYDIKGIQRFIFSVPKLKCVIGASELIAEFDDGAAGYAAGAEPVFTGGGRGAFYCPDRAVADNIARRLVAEANRVGLDVRIGVAESLSQAAHHDDQLFPCFPPPLQPDDPLAGEPCAMSAQWPVPQGAGRGPKRDVHPLVWKRAREARDNHLGTQIFDDLRHRGRLPPTLAGYELAFFKTVTPDPEDEPAEAAEAHVAQAALGRRNRWAIIALDGNDMGRQFLAFERLQKSDAESRQWLTQMSRGLARCTREAFLSALGQALAAWAEDQGAEGLSECVVGDNGGPGTPRLILPFRPLILGGDDVTLLCHGTYALDFVRNLAQAFHEGSQRIARDSPVKPLWPATDGELTISAGILFAKVTFPLHMGIRYAESLLNSAKGRYRVTDPQARKPTPAAVDWDTITDTLVDTPVARRNRELRFVDREIEIEMQLTRRPYTLQPVPGKPCLDDLLAVKERLRDLPPSVRARILPSLQRPWSERVAFIASIAKRHRFLQEQLWEDGAEVGAGWTTTGNPEKGETVVRATALPDALLLLEEEHRMTRPTVKQ